MTPAQEGPGVPVSTEGDNRTLHFTHSNLSTTFFVVFAFLWKTGLV